MKQKKWKKKQHMQIFFKHRKQKNYRNTDMYMNICISVARTLKQPIDYILGNPQPDRT